MNRIIRITDVPGLSVETMVNVRERGQDPHEWTAETLGYNYGTNYLYVDHACPLYGLSGGVFTPKGHYLDKKFSREPFIFPTSFEVQTEGVMKEAYKRELYDKMLDGRGSDDVLETSYRRDGALIQNKVVYELKRITPNTTVVHKNSRYAAESVVAAANFLRQKYRGRNGSSSRLLSPGPIGVIIYHNISGLYEVWNEPKKRSYVTESLTHAIGLTKSFDPAVTVGAVSDLAGAKADDIKKLFDRAKSSRERWGIGLRMAKLRWIEKGAAMWGNVELSDLFPSGWYVGTDNVNVVVEMLVEDFF